MKKSISTQYTKSKPIGQRSTKLSRPQKSRAVVARQPTTTTRTSPRIRPRLSLVAREQRKAARLLQARRHASSLRAAAALKNIFTRTLVQSAGLLVVLLVFGASLLGRAQGNVQTFRAAPTACTGWQQPERATTLDLLTSDHRESFTAENSATIASRTGSEAAGEPQLKCKGFTLPEQFPAEAALRHIELLVSVAAQGNAESADALVIESSLDGQQWSTLDSFFLTEDTSNALHGGYRSFPFPALNRDNLSSLQVRVRFASVPSSVATRAFVDGLALAIEAQPMVSAASLNLPANVIQVAKTNVPTNEEPVVKVELERQSRLKFLGFKDTKRTIDEVKVTNPEGVVQVASYNEQKVTEGSATFSKLNLHTDTFTKPGKYTAQVTVLQDGKLAVVTTEFIWGVLVINMNRSVYWPGETVYFGMGVLDPDGHTVCDARLTLTVVAPDGGKKIITTEQDEKGVLRSSTCGPDNITDVADYSAEYETADEGNYAVTLTASTRHGEYTITDTVVVDAVIPYAISRRGSMRIYPPAAYTMALDVRPQKAFKGVVEDYVPPSFSISAVSNGGKVIKGQQRTTIRWQVDWAARTTHTLTYRYDAPDISPEIFRLGPVQVGDYQESRQWQIASDAVSGSQLTVNSSATDSQTYNTASISPTSNALILAWVTNTHASSANTVTLSGNSLTWVQVNTTQFNGGITRITLFRAMGASPTTGAVTITVAGTSNTGAAWSIEQYTGTDTSGTNGSGAIVQSAVNTATAATSLTVTLSAFSSSSNGAAAGFGRSLNRAALAETNWTAFTQSGYVTAPANRITTQWRADNDTTATSNDSSGSFSGNWGGIAVEIAIAPTGKTIAGTVYAADESTFIGNPPCDGSSQNLSLRVNGGTAVTTSCANTTGIYSFTGVTANAGDTLTIYITNTYQANTVLIAGSGDSSAVPLYRDHLTIRDDNDGTSTILDLLDYDNDQNATDMLFDADDAATDTLSVESNIELHQYTSDIFDPNGTVTTQGTGDLHVDDSATVYLDTATSTIGSEITVDTGATLNVTATTAINGTGTSTITGTLSGTGDITNTSSVNGAGTITLTGGTFTLNAAGARSLGSTSGSNTWTFSNLTLASTSGAQTITAASGGSGATAVSGTLQLSNSGTTLAYDLTTNDRVLDVNGDVNIAASTTLTASDSAAFTVGGSWSNSGTFTHSNGLVTFDAGTTGKTIDPGSSSFYDLTFNNASGSWTTQTNALTVAHNLILTAGTFSMGNIAHTVTGTSSITGTLNTAAGATGNRTFTGAVTVNANGVWDLTGQNPATRFSGGITHNGTTFNNGTGTVTFLSSQALAGSSAMTFGGTFSEGSFVTMTNSNTSTVTIAGNVTVAGANSFTNSANAYVKFGGTLGVQTYDFTASPNTVEYNGGAQTVEVVTYHHLVLSGTGAKTMTSVTTINGNLTLAGTATAALTSVTTVGGDVTVGGGTTLDVQNNLNINGGDLATTGTSATVTTTSGTPTVTMSGTGTIGGGTTPTITLHNLTTTGTGNTTWSSVCNIFTAPCTVNNVVTVGAGTTFTIDGEITISSGQLINTTTGIITTTTGTTSTVYLTTAAGTGQLGGGAGAITLGNLSVTGGGTVAQKSATTINGGLTVSGSPTTFDMQANLIVGASGGTYTISTSSDCIISATTGTPTLTIRGTVTMPSAFGTPTITFYNLAVGDGTVGTFSTSRQYTVTNNATVATGSTFNMTSLATISGNLTNAGTGIINAGNGTQTITFDGATDSTPDIGGSGASGAVTLGQISLTNTTSATIQKAVTVLGDIMLASGTTLNANFNVAVQGGDITGDGTLTYTAGTPTLTITGTGNFGGATAWTLYNLTLALTAGSSETTTATGAGGITIVNVLTTTCGGGDPCTAFRILNGGSKTWTLSGAGSVFVHGGRLTGSTSTFEYTSGSNVNVAVPNNSSNDYYYNLHLIPASSTPTYTLDDDGGAALEISNNFVIGQGTTSITVDGTTNNTSINLGASGTLSCTTGAGTNTVNTGTGTWTSAGTVTLTNCDTFTATSGHTFVMSGTGKTLTTGGKTLHHLTLSGTITLANETHTVAGDLVLSNTVTPGTSTVTMSGTSNTITGGGFSLYNLTINPSSAGTITLQTSDLTVTNTVNIATGDALTLDSGRTLTHTGATLTLSGTLNGPGTYIYRSTTTFPTTGTLAASLILRMDASAGNQTMGARTDYQLLEIDNSSTTAGRTITPALGTITTAGKLELMNTGADPSTTTLELNTNDPTFTVGGDTTIAAGTTLSAPSANGLFLKGSYTNTSGTFTDNAGTVTLNGTGTQTMNAVMTGSSDFSTLTITNTNGTYTNDSCGTPSAYGVIFTASVTMATLNIATAGVKVQFLAGSTVTVSSTLNLQGAAGNRVVLRSSAASAWTLAAPVTQTVTYVDVSYSTATGNLVSADDGTNKDCGNNTDWTFTTGIDIAGTSNSSGGTVRVAVNGTEQAQTTTLAGTWTITGVSVSSGNVVVVYVEGTDSAETTGVSQYDGTGNMDGFVLDTNVLTIGNGDNQSIDLTDLSGYDCDNDEDVMFSSNTGTFAVQGCTNSYTDETVSVKASNTLAVGNSEALITDNFTNAGTVTSGTLGAFTVGGNWTNSSTFTQSTSTVTFSATDTGHTINNGAASFYNVIFDGSGGAWSPLTNTLTVTNDLTMTNGTFNTATGTANVTVNGNVQCGASCGTITMNSAGTNTFTQSVAASKAFGTNVAVATNWTFYNLTFTASSGTPTITTNGTGTGQIIVANTLATTNSGTSLVVDNETNDRILDVNGAVSIGSGTTLQASSTAAFTVGGNWTNGGDFTDGTGTVTLDGASQQTVDGQLTGASDRFYDLTITNASGTDPETSPSVIFAASADVADDFTANTASTKIRFVDTGTFTFQKITLNGQADSTRVALRSSSTGTQWDLNVAGARSVSYTDVRDSNACGQAPDIEADNGTNANGGNNTCWKITTLTVSLSGTTAALGTLAAGFVNQAGITSTVTTSASGGYVSFVKYGATLTSGSDTIDDTTGGNIVAGTEEFGVSSSDNGNTIAQWSPTACSTTASTSTATALTTAFQAFASAATVVTNEVTTLCFLASISGTTPPGSYTSTATVITTARF